MQFGVTGSWTSNSVHQYNDRLSEVNLELNNVGTKF